MKRHPRRLMCFGLLVLGVLLCLVSLRGDSAQVSSPKSVPSQGALPGTRFTLDIHELIGVLRDLPERDGRDQLQDWALYGVLNHQGLQGEALVKATYETYPLRLPYLEEMFTFAHGPGRRAILDEKTVVLVYEKSERDPTAVLGRLADQVRMELGEKPALFQVFAFEADVPRGVLHVERMPDLKAQDAYGPAYGYHEAVIGGPEDFMAWLSSIDDVTFARYEDPGGLTLGGRRFPNSRTRNVTVEDVAALYQAHDALEEERAALEQQLRDLDPSGPVHLPPREPGFSLDPQYRQARLVSSLVQLARDPCALIREAAALGQRAASQPEDARTETMWDALRLWKLTRGAPPGALPRVCSVLAQRHGKQFAAIARDVRRAREQQAIEEAVVPLWKLVDETKRSDALQDVVMRRVLEYVLSKERIQCARYDGPLQGTRVGMNLFYTDLLAKLWGFDIHHAAPTTSVPGFQSFPRLGLSSLDREQIEANPWTRIWFGPKQGGYSSAEEGKALLFRHVATRVYAAGSSPLAPGEEVTPTDVDRREIGWWDRHYVDIADFEQEYHLQNEIMKWSILTGWVHSRFASMWFLAAVPVKHELTFDRWLAEHREGLRYQHPVQLLPRKQWREGRECMESLSSYVSPVSGYQVSGGVSLGGRRAVESAPRVPAHGDASLRYGRGLEAAERAAPGGGVPRALPRFEQGGRVLVDATRGTRTRAGVAEVQLQHLELRPVASRPLETRLHLAAPGNDLGVFALRNEGSGVRLHFDPGAVEHVRHVATSGSLEKASVGRGIVLLKDEEVVLLPQGNPGALTRMTIGSSVEDALMTVRLGRAGEALRVKAIKDVSAREAMARYDWQYLRPSPSADGTNVFDAVDRIFKNEVPPPDSVRVILDGIPGLDEGLPVLVTPKGQLAIARPSHFKGQEAWTDLVQRTGLTPRELEGIAAKAQLRPTEVLHWDISKSLPTQKAFTALRDGKPGQLVELESLAREHPEGWTGAIQELEKTAIDNGEYALRNGRPAEALRIFEAVDSHLGASSPEVLMDRALAEMDAGLSRRGLDHFTQALDDLHGWADGKKRARHLADIADDAGLDDVGDVLRAEFGLDDALPQGIRLEVHGTKVVSTARVAAPPRGRVLTASERNALLKDRTADIYIDDRFSLNRVDIESSPADNLAVLADDPYVSWQRVESMPANSYSPTRLIAELDSRTETYTKVATASEPLSVSMIPPLVIVRNCDTNGDGAMSSEERAQCSSPN
ncbi:hypothetical protein F0U60_33285 [Archangium minus]|uniref:Uncharacterized protein n=1 Tax=Archangium minus TaxID=83450 RepID=A0ABY9WZ58_9BACT|nr:hypothetical protein F0U60_33285 [Archangium minus]